MTAYYATNTDATWYKAFSNVDWTSLGTSALISVVTMPGMSTGAKVAVTADVMVDINTEEIRTSEVIGGNKSVAESAIDIGGRLTAGKATDAFTKGVMKDATHDFAKNTIIQSNKSRSKGWCKNSKWCHFSDS